MSLRNDRYDLRTILGAVGYGLLATLIALAFIVGLALRKEARATELSAQHDVSPSHSNFVPSSARNFRHHTEHAQIVGGRPAGCPHRYCGCALSIKLFGRQVPGLNLAWEWARRFPRTQARIGAVAVRPGHVMQIIGGEPGRWLSWNPNSGRGKTRVHYASLAGYRFVNPHGQRFAEAGR